MADPSGRECVFCGEPAATARLPFAIGKQESPPLPREYRVMGWGPRRKKFYQRYRWEWHFLYLCEKCGTAPPRDRVWSSIQNHPQTVRLVAQGFTETRLDPEFSGQEGETTFTEEPV